MARSNPKAGELADGETSPDWMSMATRAQGTDACSGERLLGGLLHRRVEAEPDVRAVGVLAFSKSGVAGFPLETMVTPASRRAR